MTTTDTASPGLQQMVIDRLDASGRRAQFLSYYNLAGKGILSHRNAMHILRQLSTETHYAADDPQPRRSPGGNKPTAAAPVYASEAQARFALDLLRTRVAPDERVTGSIKTAAQVLAEADASGHLAKAMARNVIDSYKDRPRYVPVAPVVVKQAPVVAPVEPGAYQVNDDIYKVQRSKTSGWLYAQKLVDGKWNYEAGQGAMRFIKAEHLMTTEQAKTFGHRFGMCINGHPLEKRVSRYFGYGPKCAANNGWVYDEKLIPEDFE